MIPSRALAAAVLLALAAAASPRAGLAAPAAVAPAAVAPAAGAPMAPPAAPAAEAPRALLASPLVSIERIDGPAVGPFGLSGGAAGAAGEVPAYLLDPDGFTTFTQVAPPDGGHLIMLVE